MEHLIAEKTSHKHTTHRFYDSKAKTHPQKFWLNFLAETLAEYSQAIDLFIDSLSKRESCFGKEVATSNYTNRIRFIYRQIP